MRAVLKNKKRNSKQSVPFSRWVHAIHATSIVKVFLQEKGTRNCLIAIRDLLSPLGNLPEDLDFFPLPHPKIEGLQMRCHGTHGANIQLTYPIRKR